jgi:hypothetical protein
MYAYFQILFCRDKTFVAAPPMSMAWLAEKLNNLFERIIQTRSAILM